MRKFMMALILCAFSYPSFSQDTLPTTAQKKDTIQLYYQKHSAWGFPFIRLSKLFFKVGDSLYKANEMEVFLQNNQQAYVAFKSYRFNRAASEVGFYLWAGSFVLTIDALTHKRSVGLPIGAFVGTYFLKELFFQKSKRQLRKAISLYNEN